MMKNRIAVIGATLLAVSMSVTEAETDGMETLLFRNPDRSYVLVAACSEGRGLKGRKGSDGYEPRPKLYVKCGGEHKHLPLPFGTWSVTTMVFKKR